MENLRVLEGSEVFFRGLQHQYPPVQIRSSPLIKTSETLIFRGFFVVCVTSDGAIYTV